LVNIVTDNIETLAAVGQISINPNLMMVDSGAQNIVGNREKFFTRLVLSYYRKNTNMSKSFRAKTKNGHNIVYSYEKFFLKFCSWL
jgi:hypothetical protein